MKKKRLSQKWITICPLAPAFIPCKAHKRVLKTIFRVMTPLVRVGFPVYEYFMGSPLLAKLQTYGAAGCTHGIF